jgi:hypothetical protein
MKWNNIINLSFFGLLITSLLSCGEITKEIAGDDLVGTYQGKETTTAHLSKFNIGLDDEVNKQTNTFNIIKNDEGKLKVVFQDGFILLNAVQLATNGTVFNIPEQALLLDGQQIRIKGLNECTFGEMRCDGFYNNETQELTFSFEGIIPTTEQGVRYDVPFSMSYEVKKL